MTGDPRLSFGSTFKESDLDTGILAAPVNNEKGVDTSNKRKKKTTRSDPLPEEVIKGNHYPTHLPKYLEYNREDPPKIPNTLP